MLTEEALIVLVALVACGLVLLGVLELLWPTRPKHPVRHKVRAPAHNRAHGHPRHGRSGRAAGVERTQDTRPAPRSAPVTPLRSSPAPAVSSAPPVIVPEMPAVVPASPIVGPPAPSKSPPPVHVPEPVTAAEGALTIEDAATVDACFTLYQEHRYDEVIALGMASLTEDGPSHGDGRAQETAALWSIVALAKQALGDDLGARAALEAAIETAPAADRVTYRHQLASLALHVANGLLAAAAGHAAADSEQRLDALRAAVAWLDGGLAATPDDVALRDLRSTALAALWPSYEQVVMGMVQQQEFRAARRLLREALDHADFPTGRGEAFRELLSGTFSGEIGQLTAQAIRSMQEARESEALTALQRADELLGRLADEALTPKRREEVDRRLWWGYNKLGARRIEAGEFEEALEPLFHALRFAGVGPERQAETRALLVRALEGVIDTRSLAIQQLAADGDRETVVVETNKLWTLLSSATTQGIDEKALAAAFKRVHRLFEGLGRRGQP
ncbi:MAG TPA: hypothetical protein VGU22_03450 [Methylomirabilota bacterium]|nr:hypothetical protein [Methylomirabilota bacterium]